jgi:hypothetical protein
MLNDLFLMDEGDSRMAINTSEFTDDILKAKNFNMVPTELKPTLEIIPNSKAFDCDLKIVESPDGSRKSVSYRQREYRSPF